MAEVDTTTNTPPEAMSKKTRRSGGRDNTNIHRRFATVSEYVKELGGDKSHVIEKVLIANNGVAAVKAIRSIRRWSYDVFGDERAIQFVVMATPEDLRANAEYIRMGDVIVDVPGGSNNHNYANVSLIVELARLHGVQAVWAGWGHASENPVLPDTLAKSKPFIKFIGPAGPPMQALGDKIGSTIIAQTAGVPCISWNGDDVFCEYNRETGCLDEEAYRKATVSNATEAYEASKRIGFPIMIKASEGGGGKGIRKVERPEDVQNAFRQVCGEVPGSPVFIMKLSSNSRHLEVQLLADEYGNAVALNGRDCSVQRRHQKIIEEGPPLAPPPKVWDEMEKAAIALAKAVGYTNAGTVEYLYSEPDEKFYFLELNPRLQVEHPVTEMITKVNLPAAQLQVAMGIKLYHIPEIRELYGQNRFEDVQKYADGSTAIDFETTPRIPPFGHCLAVRITAENAEAGFKPTSGGIQELNFRSTPNVWGYFSMDSSGSIHEFADSQFGHLFANGSDREQARKNMVLALKELSIRGDISTTVDYISKLIELNDFVNNDIDTGWLDELIKTNVVAGLGSVTSSKKNASNVKINLLGNDLCVVIGATMVAFDKCTSDEKQFMEAIQKGQLPSQTLLSMSRDVELILEGVKYKLCCTRNGPNKFSISVACNPHSSVQANVRLLSDGGFLIDIGGKSHVAYLTNKGDAATGMKISIGGVTVAFSPDYDPTSLRTDVAGKLVKKLVPDGAHVTKGQAYCEIEVMKMFMPLKVSESGILTWCNNEGASLGPGDLIATLKLDNPENVATAKLFEGDLQVNGWGPSNLILQQTRPHLLLRKSFELIQNGMSGYVLGKNNLQKLMESMFSAITDPALPMYEIEEQLSVLSGRIDGQLYQKCSQIVSNFKQLSSNFVSTGNQLRFPSEQIVSLLSDYADGIADSSEQSAFITLTTPLREAAVPYTKSSAAGVGGSERALMFFLDILREWISVERWFCDGVSYADSVDNLRKSMKEDHAHVLQVCRAHAQLRSTSEIIVSIIDSIAGAIQVDVKTSKLSPIGKRMSLVTGAQSLSDALPCLSEIGSMAGNDIFSSVALRARKLLLQESQPSLEERKKKINEQIELIIAQNRDISTINDETHVPLADIFYPLLDSLPQQHQKLALLELNARKLYQTQILRDFERIESESMLKFTFSAKASESHFSATTRVASMTDLTRALSQSTSMQKLGESSESSDTEGNVLKPSSADRVPPGTSRTAIWKLVDSAKDILNDGDNSSFAQLLSSIPQFNKNAPKCQAGPINNLYIIVTKETIPYGSMDAIAQKLEQLLIPHHSNLASADVRRVSFVFNNEDDTSFGELLLPSIFTYRACLDFKEDSLFRNIEPSHAYRLDLTRLSKNFAVKRIDSTQTVTGNVHLYRATPKILALAKDKTAKKEPRIFVRALSNALEFSSTSFERILVDALNALDLVAHGEQPATDNHLFINMVSDFESIVLDPVVVEQAIVAILKRHGERVSGLNISEVETKLICCLSEDSPPIALRIVGSNPTGYVHVINTYVEAEDNSGTPKFKLIGGTKASFACSGDSSWEGMKVSSPYPLTRPFDAQRRAALRATDSLYCYDIPSLFEEAVEQQWEAKATKGGVDGSMVAASRPLMVMYTTELVVQKKSGRTDPWTMQDYLNNDLELSQKQRGAGANDVGMVAWLMTLKTFEYPNGREIVLIANDITHKAGSFGTREDVVFKLASEFAREKSLPRLYIAANSGARIGLAEGIKKSFKVAFKDPSKPENGFDFLYVTKDDYDRFTSDVKQIEVEPATYEGQSVFKIKDIIGIEPDLGVENLKGSGLIAGETSCAYNDIFTMTIVLGRTVGIGAYLVRLGQRTIQKSSSSPIILTGYQALNKLMGVDVYSTNDQLGGPGIMYSNGISHLVEPDHLKAISSAIQWLSFVPSTRGALLPITDIHGIDEIQREITFSPTAGVPYDPRHLLTGKLNDDDVWLSGFFDKGSFIETLSGWAKSVVVGRARLGGIPMGVIVTENRTAEAIKPADPADVKASEAVIQEAGCVWFPNSAYKTAQAINDFRTEDLPLIVFANWRGFSGGQRDMFDEVLKYGSLIVDAFVAYQQPVFVFIPPFAEIRGGAWVVLDASINSSVMEMYASSRTARGGVLEANGAASVKFRTKDLIKTMHRLDDTLISLDKQLESVMGNEETKTVEESIKKREQSLLPVYEQIAVQFCELHDTPGRMKAVGVIQKEVEWNEARSYFYWRLRRKLAEFDLRKKMIEAGNVGRGTKTMSGKEASAMMRDWFLQSPGMTPHLWDDDQVMLKWMAENFKDLQGRVVELSKFYVMEEVYQAMTVGGSRAQIGTSGIVDGIKKAYDSMDQDKKEYFKQLMKQALEI